MECADCRRCAATGRSPADRAGTAPSSQERRCGSDRKAHEPRADTHLAERKSDPFRNGHDIRQSDLFRQLREEIVVRERYSTWQQINRQIVRDRPVTATRTREEEAAEAVLAVRRMHMFRPALHFTGNPRWVVDGVLLDPESERFLVRSSRQRILYRERMMAGQTPDV